MEAYVFYIQTQIEGLFYSPVASNLVAGVVLDTACGLGWGNVADLNYMG